MIDRTIRTSVSSFCLAAALALGYSGGAQATPWLNGNEITYAQSDWGSSTGTAQNLLISDYTTVYAPTGGIFLIGEPSTYYMLFDSGLALHAYLPQPGAAGVLNDVLFDPTISSSGAFGGDVAALKLNVDFTDAGFLVETSGVAFGNLLLTGFTGASALLDGLTVRQFLGDANTCLGGVACLLGVSDMDLIASSLNASFDGGVTVSTFAQDHLAVPTVSQVPEPSSLLLFASGMLAFGAMKRFRRQK